MKNYLLTMSYTGRHAYLIDVWDEATGRWKPIKPAPDLRRHILQAPRVWRSQTVAEVILPDET